MSTADPNSPQGIDGVGRFLGMRWESAELWAQKNPGPRGRLDGHESGYRLPGDG